MLILAAADQSVPIKDVTIPPALYWYMGAIVLVCLLVFLLLPKVLATRSRPIPRQDAPDADND